MATPARPNAAAKTPAAPSIQQQLQQMNPPTQVGVIAFIAVAVLVLYYMVLYSSLDTDIVHERQRTQTLNEQLHTAQVDEREYNTDVEQLDRSRTRARELQRILPDNPDIPGFMRNINTLAESNGLAISLVEPEAEHVEQYYAREPVRLEVNGSYLALARFFRAVSQLPRVINMENITLSDAALENGEMHLKARVLATTFRTLTPDEAAAGRRGGAAGAPGTTPGGHP